MHVFLTGGSGQLGPAVVSELITAGHRVTGLARSDAAAEQLEGLGAAVLRGSLDDLGVLADGAEQSDGVVHMAFGSAELHDPLAVIHRDMTAIRTLGDAIAGTDKPLVSTSGTFATAPGRISTEGDPASPEAVAGLRSGSERVSRELASQGIRSILVRLAPSVHGPGDRGLVPALVSTARRTGVSAYV